MEDRKEVFTVSKLVKISIYLELVLPVAWDDGKSTLIGRLFYDSKAIFEDRLALEECKRRRERMKLTCSS